MDWKEEVVGWIKRRRWLGGLEGGSGGMEARWAWKYPEMSRSYTFELGFRQVSEEPQLSY